MEYLSAGNLKGAASKMTHKIFIYQFAYVDYMLIGFLEMRPYYNMMTALLEYNHIYLTDKNISVVSQ